MDNVEREAARLEAMQAVREVQEQPKSSEERRSAAEYANAALNVWQEKLDEWGQRMGA